MSTNTNVIKKKKYRNSFGGSEVSMLVIALPFLILFFIMTVLPVLASLVLSFCSYDTLSSPKWAGLDNFLRMFVTDDMFSTVATNTIIFAVITAPAGFLLSYVLAWFINEFNPSVRSFLSFLFYAPNLVGNAYFIWQTAFSADSYGYVNSLLLSVGLLNEPVQWLTTPDYIVPIIIAVTIWSSMGVSFLADIAGLQSINVSLFEAGAIDGIRNRWQELWYITLPSMKEILLFGAVMQIASSFSIGPVITTMCTYPTVNNCADTIVMYLADIAHTRMEMGYAAAISIFLFALMAIFRGLIGKLLSSVGK
ncbi:MAG: sugar ABC transporter permease [Ruminococcaceae bacterium]|nr:sugar ABC transporter permease [Oscillospiraceae bacterium]